MKMNSCQEKKKNRSPDPSLPDNGFSYFNLSSSPESRSRYGNPCPATYKFSWRIPSRIASSALPDEEKYLSPSVDRQSASLQSFKCCSFALENVISCIPISLFTYQGSIEPELCRPQPLHTPVWTQMTPPQAEQVHFFRSRSRRAAIPASRMNRRFSNGDSRSGYCDPYRVSFSMTSAQGKSG